MPDALWIERLWYGDGGRAALARALLTPISWGFRAAVRARNALYDTGVLHSSGAAIPVLSVGNLTVGGTGKTPVAAYLAGRLRQMGARPALVMRGVGDDESKVFAFIAPGVPVIADPQRTRGVAAAVRAGCDVAVLDDAFQHRAIRRDVDVVLVSADRSADRAQVLPAGPLREPWTALSRAHTVIVTRKAASTEQAASLRDQIQLRFPGAKVAQVLLTAAELVRWSTEERHPIDVLRGRRVLAVAGIGDPAAFLKQLGAYASQVEACVFRDHHAYSEREAGEIATSANAFDLVVCTLKDAVKLGPVWPRQGPALWYVSQHLEVEKGEDEIERMLARLLDLRPANRS
ncbi:MAG TPA: tetraacyldisaccharide 4'-kinase [Gemmatimonadaceae bacterium]|nr:tetraacyldisaccharide 4'-kinase [Gemmatimonadaceae bacterium]